MAAVDMRQLAALGAQARLAQLREEEAAIYAEFPDLRTGARRRVNGASAPVQRRKRRTMSAAQRKAVSIRMARYWAERRKAAAAKK